MSFVKALFLVVLVLLLMPSNGEERYELYATAQRTLADIGGFCTRNPDVCEKVSSGFEGILHKLKSTAESIEDMLRDAGIAVERDNSRADYSNGYERQSAMQDTRSTVTSSFSNDTLTTKDRQPAWRGPNPL